MVALRNIAILTNYSIIWQLSDIKIVGKKLQQLPHFSNLKTNSFQSSFIPPSVLNFVLQR